MENQESLKTSARLGEFPDSVKNQVNNLLANGVVTPGVVVGGVLLAIDQLLRMVELTVGSNSGLVDDSWLQVNEDSSWDMLSASSLREEGLEGVVSKGLVRRHMAIRLDSMLETVQLPARIPDLTAGLTHVD